MTKNNSKPQRELRQKQAAERQERYNKLTTLQKLTQIEARPGESKKERYWLELDLERSK